MSPWNLPHSIFNLATSEKIQKFNEDRVALWKEYNIWQVNKPKVYRVSCVKRIRCFPVKVADFSQDQLWPQLKYTTCTNQDLHTIYWLLSSYTVIEIIFLLWSTNKQTPSKLTESELMKNYPKKGHFNQNDCQITS